jgi:exocyst complex component 2
MRSTLKKLREASKNEFACFKKPKRSGAAKVDPAASSS